MRIRKTAVVVSLLFGSSLCLPAAAQAATSYPVQVLQETNKYRQQGGCPALIGNGQLTVAAQVHTDEMAKYRYMSHTGVAGDNPDDRITGAGYKWSRWGENIAAGQRTPQQVVTWWMNSPPHRANILNCAFREIGIWYTSGARAYWTQDFGTARGT
ncbi:CAP domain-containing protein [Amycolatopsis solani]|uniref:CAP domain-containing protein n=1 Tax=Amycolatopsis solani TaxID=3028615 RepID=UPI0025B18F01|nr:CAP domain-containing protein [Amycolatopsis sp. MEP2-6]